jgi:fumarylacetoacetase
LQTLPYGVFSEVGEDACHLGVAIAGHVLDLSEAQHLGLVDDLDGGLRPALRSSRLNRLLALTPGHWSALRHRLFALLVDDDGAWRGVRELVRQCLVPMAAVRMHLPFDIGDYTDFYASIHHATNVGTMLRPEQPLLPNYRHVPIGYHGRASSVVVSGTPIVRPHGQRLPAGADVPVFGPSERLDYELEVGLVIGGENPLGAPVPIDRARDRVFGLVLLNDWSARDIQAWEYQPLGPFLSKNFGSTIAPWVVTMEALAPFRVPFERPAGDPPPLPYLDSAANRAHGMLDIRLAVSLQTRAMRDAGLAPARLSASAVREAAYWTPAQLVAHHTINGCNLQPGDLLGSGTLSGPRAGEAGSLLELTLGGERPLQLPNGERRTFLDDGDTITIAGWCERAGTRRIGFGPCSATVRPAPGLG